MKKKNAILEENFVDDNRPVSEEIKLTDYIYFSNEKKFSYEQCEGIAKLLTEGGYGSIKRFAKRLLEQPLDDLINLLEEAAK